MALDLAVLAVFVAAALGGALSGALRQVVQLAAVVVGWLAARHLGPAVAAGFAKSVPALVARPAASALLFVGGSAATGLLAAAILRARGLAQVVRGPADRGLGALLAGAKGGLVVWVLLSAAALAGPFALGPVRFDPAVSDFAGFAAEHNLLERIDPGAARTLQKIDRLRGDDGATGAEREVAPPAPDARPPARR